jgi:hypothetical protein
MQLHIDFEKYSHGREECNMSVSVTHAERTHTVTDIAQHL